MTAKQSFSELLRAKLAEEKELVDAEKKAQEEEQWLQKVNSISAWLRLVFNDDSFELIGYKLQNQPRKSFYILIVYVRVGNFVYGLDTRRYRDRYSWLFGICLPRNGKTCISTQLCRLQQVCKENKSRTLLELDTDPTNANDEFVRESPESEKLRERLRNEIVAATVNVVKNRPDRAEPSACQAILASLPKQRNFRSLVSANKVLSSTTVPTQNVEEYLANIPPDILSMALSDFIPIPDNENAAKEREKSLGCLSPCGLLWVRDILRVDYSALQQWGKNQYWATRAIVEELAKYDLELVPPTGSEYLPQDVPKTVNQLLNKSGLKGVERPRNCLGRAQIVTTQQLLLQTESDLLALTNFGQKSLQTVNAALAQYGLKLASE